MLKLLTYGAAHPPDPSLTLGMTLDHLSRLQRSSNGGIKDGMQQANKDVVVAGLSSDLDALRDVIRNFAASDPQTTSRAEVVFDVLVNLRDRIEHMHSSLDPLAAREIKSISDELTEAADACPDHDFAVSIQAVSVRLAALMFSLGVAMSTDGLVFAGTATSAARP